MINRKIVGRINGQHGVKGHLKIFLDSEINELKKGTWIYFEIQNKPVPFFIEDHWGDDKVLIVKVRGVDSPEKATEFNGVKIGLDPKNVKDENAVGANELVGYELLNAQTKTSLGDILDVFDNTAHLLAKIEINGQEVLIPIHEELVESIDEKGKKITLHIPEGLMDL